MLLCLHYCAKDYEQAHRLAEWLGELGPFPNHDLLLFRDHRAPKSLVVMFGFANFKEQNEIVITDDVANSWPASANHAFKKIAKHVQYSFGGQPFLYIEPDCVILRASAFNEIEAEYCRALAAKKPFLGDLIDQRGNKAGLIPHMSGVGCYPGNMTRFAGEVFQADETTPWDIVAGPAIFPQAMQSELIMHWWNREGQGLAPFTSWADIEAKIFARRPRCAIFHSAKDDSLIRLLRERKNFSGDVERLAGAKPDSQHNHVDGSEGQAVAQRPVCAELPTAGMASGSGSDDPPAETLPSSAVGGFPVEPELSDNGGLSQGTPTTQGVTAGETASISESRHDQAPWENREESIVEIRRIAQRLKQFQTTSPRVRFVRSLLHEAGVVDLPYRFKRRKGWKRNKAQNI